MQACAVRLAAPRRALGQRMAEWAERAPALGEDVARHKISRDLVGKPRSLLSAVGDEHELDLRRDEKAWTNALVMELDNGDFGQTMAR